MAALPRPTRPSLLLAAACALHGVSSVTLVALRHGFGWDETVYLSQINRFVPAGIWSAPRARGVTLLVAPATLLTPSLAATRLWLALLSSVLLYVGFRPWLRLVPPYAVALAALLFSALWQTIFYGAEAMPNLFVACFAIPAVALTVLYLREPARWSRLLWLGLCLAAIALIRPSDGVYTAAPIGLVVLLARTYAWRPRILALVALAAGIVVGAGEWVIEAFVSFGGPMQRYHAALAEQGGSGLQFSLVANVRTLAGPLLCRQHCYPHPPAWALVWWGVTAVLVVLGLVWARGASRLPVVLATVTGLVMGAQYIFEVAYSAPRFLLPAYALLFIGAATALVEAVQRAPGQVLRGSVAALVAVVVAAQVVSQIVVLRERVLPPTVKGLAIWDARGRLLRQDVLDGRPCAVAGPSSAPVAYRARCRSVSMTAMRNNQFPPATQRFVLSGARIDVAGTWLSGWQEYKFPMRPRYGGRLYVYLPPGETLPVPAASSGG